MTVRKIDVNLDHRIETGAVKFGDDWPGLFVRGDDCPRLYFALRTVLGWTADDFGRHFLEGIMQHINEATGIGDAP